MHTTPTIQPELRHNRLMSTRSGFDIPQPDVAWQDMKRVFYDGKDARNMISGVRVLEKEMGMKARVPTKRASRNEIEVGPNSGAFKPHRDKPKHINLSFRCETRARSRTTLLDTARRTTHPRHPLPWRWRCGRRGIEGVPAT